MSNPKVIDTKILDTSSPTVDSISSYIVAKRLFDLSLILLFSPIIALVMVVTAVLIKLESNDPILFWQKRVGMHGKVFNIVKFRSMTTDSEKHGSQFAETGDARITKLGHFIRKMRIDELPQLWNVLRGEMSLIGPRPEQVVFVKEFEKTISNYGNRHNVLPGITGLAQIEQGYVDDANGTRTKLKYDLYYIENISFLMDMRIVFQTLYTMSTGFGAR